MDADNITGTADPSFTIDYEENQAVFKFTFFSLYPYILVADYVAILIAIPGNILTIVAYFKYDSLRTCTNMLIVNQSFSDTLLLFLAQPYLWANYTEWAMEVMSKNKYTCLLVLGIGHSSIVGSVANLMSLAVERLIAVCYARRYYALVTEARVKRAIVGLWVYMVLVGIIPIFGVNTWVPGRKCLGALNYPAFYLFFVVLLPTGLSLIVTAILNIIIAVVAFKKNKITPPVIAGPGNENPATNQDQSFKVTRMLLTVVGVFYSCWLPWTIITLVIIFPPWEGPTPEWWLLAHEISKIFLAVNAAANPFIYAWRNEHFRRAFMKLLRMKIPNQTYPEPIPSTSRRSNNEPDAVWAIKIVN